MYLVGFLRVQQKNLVKLLEGLLRCSGLNGRWIYTAKMNFTRISVSEARQMIEQDSGAVQIVDIRDDESFRSGHIKGALHLHNANMQEFLQQADPEKPVLVCCYHGHMSQSAAAFLAEQGFGETFSLDGGYEAWSELESLA